MTTLSYKLVGSGPTKVVLAHSWLADHRTFEPAFPYLDPQRFTFAFPDFRGYGASKAITGKYSVQEMGEDLVALCDQLGWDEFHLVGHSMGGQTAQWLAGNKLHQARILSVTLFCAVPARGFPLDPQGAAFFGSAANNLEVRGQCASAVTAGRLGSGFSNQMRELSADGAPSATIAEYLRTWTEQDVSKEIASYSGQVRIYVGQFDPVLTAEVSREQILPHFPQASVDTIPGAAHYPAQETPAYFAALLNTLGDPINDKE